MVAGKEEIVGAWDSGKGYSASIVFKTPYGTAHAGATRKWYAVPEDVKKDVDLLQKIHAAVADPAPPPPVVWPKPHPLLVAPDNELAAAFQRWRDDPESTMSALLNDWEFKFACDAPVVFEKWNGFTWKQRKCLREIVKKILR